jgi:nitrite reductase (NADH) large subunit
MALVCHCHAVSDREILAEVGAGAADVEAVQAACEAGSSCGGCLAVVEELVAGALITSVTAA